MNFPWNFYEGFVPIAFLLPISLLKCMDHKDLGHLPNYTDKKVNVDLVPYLAWVFFLVSFCLFLRYSISVLNQISTLLGISILWVPKDIINAPREEEVKEKKIK
jgi:hypothetical protein